MTSVKTAQQHGEPDEKWLHSRRPLGPWTVLVGNRDLTLLVTAQSLSSLVDWLYIVALFVLAYGLTHSATVVALLTFTRLLPYAVIVPFGGALTDRVDRKRLMVAASAGRAVCLLGLVGVQSRTSLPLAFVLVFAATFLSSLFRPAALSSLPALIGERELVQANALVSQVDMLALGLGPALAGLILAVGKPQAAFIVGALGLAGAAAAVSIAHIPPTARSERAQRNSWAADLVAGFHILFHDDERALLGVTLALAGFSLENGAFWTISTVLVQRDFHLGGSGLGFLMTAYAVGGSLAGFAVGVALIRRGVTTVFIAGAALSSVALAFYGISPGAVLPFFFLFVIGVADVFAKVIATTVIQTATPKQLLGRVFGALESILMFAMVAGSLIIGPLINAVGVRMADVIVSCVGLLFLVAGLPFLARLERVLGVRLFLHQVPALNAVTFSLLDELAARFRVERFAAGSTIVWQGERGDKFYIVKRGTVEVIVERGDDDIHLATMGRMDYFGEIALLQAVPRTATVRCSTPVEVYSLVRNDFQELLQRATTLEEEMRRESRTRDESRYNTLRLHV